MYQNKRMKMENAAVVNGPTAEICSWYLSIEVIALRSVLVLVIILGLRNCMYSAIWRMVKSQKKNLNK